MVDNVQLRGRNSVMEIVQILEDLIGEDPRTGPIHNIVTCIFTFNLVQLSLLQLLQCDFSDLSDQFPQRRMPNLGHNSPLTKLDSFSIIDIPILTIRVSFNTNDQPSGVSLIVNRRVRGHPCIHWFQRHRIDVGVDPTTSK
ncbi:hypothetical protein WICPIJ_003009 [Wickerhamomyces pijperi]|uniref:Uncharacterized protein n=1 Tax=Wickerhamomyces pijperi TaxID=599730 RepID=A0A9P8QAR1_WICPI|nr:hypothetical protein WICPIJ_003009 [Wickerhamomyces pijperi]